MQMLHLGTKQNISGITISKACYADEKDLSYKSSSHAVIDLLINSTSKSTVRVK